VAKRDFFQFWKRSRKLKGAKQVENEWNRRKFLGAGAAAGLSIIPSHVLGGQSGTAPSDMVHVAYVGCGTEGLLEMMAMLTIPEVRIVAVCDPNKDNTNYHDFGSDRVTSGIRQFLGKPDWRANQVGIACGRDVAKEVIESYYQQFRPGQASRGVATYADFRELLAKERDIDAVKIMTPDHLHATIAVAAMRQKKHTIVHKPIANRMREAEIVFQTARQTGVATYFMPWSGTIDQTAKWIRDGAIGTLREIHNWTDRPYWPQWYAIPDDRPPVPKDFDWDLWLGPVPDRPFHFAYTNMVFRGWYEFGGGSMADMGHYSLWPVFASLNLPSAISAIPNAVVPWKWAIDGKGASIAHATPSKVSYPDACSVHFKLPAGNGNPPIDLYWYDGGMRPSDPEELREDNRTLGATGMLFIGDKGKILDNRIIPESRGKAYLGTDYTPPGQGGRGGRGGGGGGRGGQGGQAQTAQAAAGARGAQPAAAAQAAQGGGGRGGRGPGQAGGMGGPSSLNGWIANIKGGAPAPGNFLNAIPITETFNLGYLALRTNGRIDWDPVARRVTNNEAANDMLSREYRKGWELQA